MQALFQVHHDAFSEGDSHSFNRGKMTRPARLQGETAERWNTG